MTFTLYNAPQSTCSQRVRFVLNAKNIPFGEIKLDLLGGDQLKPDYLASTGAICRALNAGTRRSPPIRPSLRPIIRGRF
jgi:hypothetical protein